MKAMADLLRGDLLDTQLVAIGLETWKQQLRPLLESRMSASNHGDFARWREVIEALASAAGDPQRLRTLLLDLSP